MKELNHYSIPLIGLTDGTHEFEFDIDKTFFKKFEESIVADGTFKTQVQLIKQPDAMFLTFDINGTIKANCDRCLANIDLPVTGSYTLLAKYAETASETEDVIYLTSDQSTLQLAKTIYDFIGLSIPLVKRYDCENEDPAVCDEEMIAKIDGQESDSENEANKENPIWDALKDFGKN